MHAIYTQRLHSQNPTFDLVNIPSVKIYTQLTSAKTKIKQIQYRNKKKYFES